MPANFNVGLYETLSKTSKPPRPGREPAPIGPGGGHLRGRRSTSTYDRETEDSSAVIPGPGAYARLTVADAARRAGVGHHQIGCPHHPSVSGRSATLHVFESGGYCLSCHVECVTYVYPGPTVDVDAVILDLLGDDDTDVDLPHQDEEQEQDQAVAVDFRDEHLRLADDRVQVLRRLQEASVVADFAITIASSPFDNDASPDEVRDVSPPGLRLSEEDRPGGDIPPESLVAEATARRDDIATAPPTVCRRGALVTRCTPTSPASTSKAPCLSWTCPDCGPRLVEALRAAGYVEVKAKFGDWSQTTWRAFRVPLPPKGSSTRKAMERWIAAGPEHRHFLAAHQHPDRAPEALVIWANGNMPAEGTVLRTYLDEFGKATDSHIPVAVDELFEGVDLQAWKNKGPKRALILLGSERLKHRIARLRDAVLGRPRALHRKADPEEIVIRHDTSLKKVHEEVERRTGEAVVVEHVDVERRSGVEVTTWGSEGIYNVLCDMLADGFFETRDQKKVKPKLAVIDLDDADEEDSGPYRTLTLAA